MMQFWTQGGSASSLFTLIHFTGTAFSHTPPSLLPPCSHWVQVGVIYGSPEITSGGQALKYYASVRLEVRIKEKIAGNDGQIGIRVK